MFFEGMSEDLICSVPDEKIDFNEIDNFPDEKINNTETRKKRNLRNQKKLVIPKGSSLPLDHKPCRGRARIEQLKRMTKKQKKEEFLLRLEKNRLAAKEVRKKKKEYICKIETQLENLKQTLKGKDKEIRNLNIKIKFLTDQFLGNQEQKQEN